MRRLLRALILGLWSGLLLITPLASASPRQIDLTAINDPLTAAFTYQGRLEKGGELVTATCAMTFSLFDAATAGTKLGNSQTINPVEVSQGLFTVSLNGAGEFGASAFEGNARFLEIAVLCPGDSSAVTLPRQQLTATPYAITSLSTQGLQGRPVSAVSPTIGQTLTWNGNEWTPQTFSGGSNEWSSLSGIPSGFADDVDNDSGGDITGVAAGSGLSGGGLAGDVSLTLDTEITDNLYWSLDGNAEAPATGFLGTTNNMTLTLATSNTTALRLLPSIDLTNGDIAPTLIGGHSTNSVAEGVAGAMIGGGSLNKASASYSTIPGGEAALATLYGQFAYAAGGFVDNGAQMAGSAQSSIYLLRNEGVGNLVLFLDGEDDRLTIRPGTSMIYSAYIIGRSTTATEFTAAYHIDGAIYANDIGTTVASAGTPNIVTFGESNFSANLDASASAVNGALRINIENSTGHAMRWVATIYTTEITE